MTALQAAGLANHQNLIQAQQFQVFKQELMFRQAHQHVHHQQQAMAAQQAIATQHQLLYRPGMGMALSGGAVIAGAGTSMPTATACVPQQRLADGPGTASNPLMGAMLLTEAVAMPADASMATATALPAEVTAADGTAIDTAAVMVLGGQRRSALEDGMGVHLAGDEARSDRGVESLDDEGVGDLDGEEEYEGEGDADVRVMDVDWWIPKDVAIVIDRGEGNCGDPHLPTTVAQQVSQA